MADVEFTWAHKRPLKSKQASRRKVGKKDGWEAKRWGRVSVQAAGKTQAKVERDPNTSEDPVLGVPSVLG